MGVCISPVQAQDTLGVSYKTVKDTMRCIWALIIVTLVIVQLGTVSTKQPGNRMPGYNCAGLEDGEECFCRQRILGCAPTRGARCRNGVCIPGYCKNGACKPDTRYA